mgnify:CR=1 FL=1
MTQFNSGEFKVGGSAALLTVGLADLRLVSTDSAPSATANVEYVLNLPGNASQPVAPVIGTSGRME